MNVVSIFIAKSQHYNTPVMIHTTYPWGMLVYKTGKIQYAVDERVL